MFTPDRRRAAPGVSWCPSFHSRASSPCSAGSRRFSGADLEVGESEIVLVQGPNGAGKSTLLRVCAGLLRIESGRAEVLGHDLVADRAAATAGRAARARHGAL